MWEMVVPYDISPHVSVYLFILIFEESQVQLQDNFSAGILKCQTFFSGWRIMNSVLLAEKEWT